MKFKRIEWIDFGRGFTIFLVVVGHVLSGIYTNHIYPNSDGLLMFFGEFIFLFIMPVFFSLSGYFFKAPENMVDYIVMIKKKAWNILVPYIVFSFVYVLLNQLGGSLRSIAGAIC
ncbi:acyltransferase family protein [Lactobacillus jensenii]|nr:acyltransferase family protein [Lactobacillus jensenii]MDK7161964.1 acyltransferase family protein [Lactobacillus jensenii]MDX5102211.1 acyltransferase family protein [Lactobacillus jensenii]MDX5114437.1 acyltransferase family protein [Lactobacillus jensenii]